LFKDSSFALEWQLAKLLAPYSRADVQRDIARSWDSLTARGIDIDRLYATIELLRRVAAERYEMTEWDTGGVRRLTRELEDVWP
jgi:hypothetical protein